MADVAQLSETVEQMRDTIEALSIQLDEYKFPLNPRSLNLKPALPPTFKGAKDQDVHTWLFAMNEHYEMVGSTTDRDKVRFAGSRLEAAAGTWWRFKKTQADEAGTQFTWDNFTTQIKTQFGRMNEAFSARAELKAIKQTSSVEDYIHRFSEINMRILDMTHIDRIFNFVAGLKPKPKEAVLVGKPTTVDAAIELAAAQGLMQVDVDTAVRHAPVYQGNQSFSSGSTAVPMELGAMYQPKRPAFNKPYQQPYQHPRAMTPSAHVPAANRAPLQRLSPAERAELRRTNSCFKCRQPGHLAKDCPTARRPNARA